MRVAGAVLVCSLVASCGSCSGGGADGGTDGGRAALPNPALDPLKACERLAAAAGGYENICGRLASADVAAYEAAQCPLAVFAPREAAFDAGLLAYSATAVDCSVASLLGGLDGGGLPCNAGGPVFDPSCGQLAWGVLTLNDTCDDLFSCNLGLSCVRGSPAAMCGTCTADSQLGDPCGLSGNGLLCGDGFCNGDACVELATVNQACDLSTAICIQPNTCHVEGCQAPGPADAGCSIDADCEDGLRCGLFSSHCQAPAGLGDSCALVSCGPGLACQQNATGYVCVALEGGGPCVYSDGGDTAATCLDQESCRGDAGCVALSALGEPCQAASDCWEGTCGGGICVLFDGGALCTGNQDCITQRCDIDGLGVCGGACR